MGAIEQAMDDSLILVNKERYYKFKETASLNRDEIDKLAEEKYNKWLNQHPIPIDIKINDYRNVFYYHNPVYDSNHSERSGFSDPDEKMAYKISDEIIEAINKEVCAYVKEIKGSQEEEIHSLRQRTVIADVYMVVATFILIISIIAVILLC